MLLSDDRFDERITEHLKEILEAPNAHRPPDLTENFHELITDTDHDQLTIHQQEVSHRIFVRKHVIVNVNGLPRTGKTRTAVMTTNHHINFTPSELTLVLMPTFNDIKQFMQEYHHHRTDAAISFDELIVITPKPYVYDYADRSIVTYEPPSPPEDEELDARQRFHRQSRKPSFLRYDLMSHLLRVIQKAKEDDDHAPEYSKRVEELCQSYIDNKTRHPTADVNDTHLYKIVVAYNRTAVIVGTMIR